MQMTTNDAIYRQGAGRTYCTALKKETDLNRRRLACSGKGKVFGRNELPFPLSQKSVITVCMIIRLDGKDFMVETVGTLNIQLRDPDEVYPVARSESKENSGTVTRQPGNIHLHNLTVNLTPAHEPDEDKPLLTDEELTSRPSLNNRIIFFLSILSASFRTTS